MRTPTIGIAWAVIASSISRMSTCHWPFPITSELRPSIPVPRPYWMDLGSAYEMAGNVAGADLAFRNAQKQYPVSAQADWAYGNFLLRQGRTQDAFRQIYRAISAGSPAHRSGHLQLLAKHARYRSDSKICSARKSRSLLGNHRLLCQYGRARCGHGGLEEFSRDGRDVSTRQEPFACWICSFPCGARTTPA